MQVSMSNIVERRGIYINTSITYLSLHMSSQLQKCLQKMSRNYIFTYRHQYYMETFVLLRCNNYSVILLQFFLCIYLFTFNVAMNNAAHKCKLIHAK